MLTTVLRVFDHMPEILLLQIYSRQIDNEPQWIFKQNSRQVDLPVHTVCTVQIYRLVINGLMNQIMYVAFNKMNPFYFIENEQCSHPNVKRASHYEPHCRWIDNIYIIEILFFVKYFLFSQNVQTVFQF